MKEIISKRQKMPWLIMLLLSVLPIATSATYLKFPTFRPFSIVFMAVFSVPVIFSIIFLLDTNGVIVKDGDILIVKRGLLKNRIPISSIIDVFQTPNPQAPSEIIKNAVTIRTITDEKEKDYICTMVINPSETIEKIKGLI